MARRLCFGASIFALFLLQTGDCMCAMNMDQRSMQCCHSMACTEANHSQDCSKHMLSAQALSLLPGHHVSLQSPAVTTIEYPLLTDTMGHVPTPALMVDAPEHSPPDLYTLHSSLLI